ncbi:EthD domain-containing protein [Aeromicrobium endophyticum]|uniref:EthD domain-containing protein n=1 Tax=Aeromicrobium endophyticum TaxID=2292704 RepID=UPI00131404DB|nr:EthD domain-containing protein [Aeromicrobium endophyticum]
MIRFFSLIPRRPDIERQRFHDHLRHPHGTMGRQIPGMLTYVQAHQFDTDRLGPGQDEFDAVSMPSFDSAKDADALVDEPLFVENIRPDEPLFQDLTRVVFFITEEEVITSRPAIGASDAVDRQWDVLERPTSIQLLQFVRLDGNHDWAGADDAELGRRIGALRHAVNRPSTEVYSDSAAPFLGARQLWWPTLTAFQDGVDADRAAFDELIAQAGHAITMLTVSERFLR